MHVIHVAVDVVPLVDFAMEIGPDPEHLFRLMLIT